MLDTRHGSAMVPVDSDFTILKLNNCQLPIYSGFIRRVLCFKPVYLQLGIYVRRHVRPFYRKLLSMNHG